MVHQTATPDVMAAINELAESAAPVDDDSTPAVVLSAA